MLHPICTGTREAKTQIQGTDFISVTKGITDQCGASHVANASNSQGFQIVKGGGIQLATWSGLSTPLSVFLQEPAMGI